MSRKTVWLFESKKIVDKVCVYLTKYTICNLVHLRFKFSKHIAKNLRALQSITLFRRSDQPFSSDHNADTRNTDMVKAH